jgi:hypothetical protein
MGQMGQMVWILSRQGSWTLVTAFIVAMFVVVVVAMLMMLFFGGPEVLFSGFFEALPSLTAPD